MLAPRDRVFLKDYADLAAKNHLYAALALRQAIISPHGHVDDFEASSAIHEAELVTEELKISEAGRLQVICQAKIFAEMVAAYEDFGALCCSVSRRHEQEILSGYLRCPVGHVDSFFRRALKTVSPTLSSLLELPVLGDVLRVVPEDLGQIFSESYDELPKYIVGAAQHYASLPDKTFAATLVHPPPDWRERISIFVRAVPAGTEPGPEAVIHRRVFEKIKHRFVVLTRMGDYPENAGGDDVHGVSYPRTRDFIDDMIMHLDGMTRFARDLPYMLLNMDDHGLL